MREALRTKKTRGRRRQERSEARDESGLREKVAETNPELRV